jgi:phage baseplate assembly protein W
MTQPTVQTIADQWLGTGLRFPIRPDPLTGGLPRVSGMDRIRQSIEQILDTEPGERIMMPEFGCGLRRYLMEPNTLTTRTAIAKDIETALTRWEPRIQLTDVSVTAGDEPELAWVSISYQRLSDLRQDNLVYPFYFRG